VRKYAESAVCKTTGHRYIVPAVCNIAIWRYALPTIFKITAQLYRVIQKDGLNFVRLYFLNYRRYVNDLHDIW